MKDIQSALIWITDILKKHDIPFQITGGLAAIAYGATRPLVDIDIDIPDDAFTLINDDIRDYITYGPSHYKSDKWDLLLMTLNYQGQDIDLSVADQTYIYDEKTKKWVKLTEDLTNAPMQNVFGLRLPVIAYGNLINYKKILSRDVDLIDIQQMEEIGIRKMKIEKYLITPLTPELCCSDIKKSLLFYTEILGFTIQYQREEDRFAMLERQGSRIMLDEIHINSVNKTDRIWILGSLERPFGRGVNLQMKTDKVDELYDHIQKSGTDIFLPIEEKWYRANDVELGQRQFIVFDPDGYALRFFQDL